MPKILVEVPDTVESVMRPVVLDITRALFKNTSITDDIRILFPGDLQRAQQVGAAIDKTGDDVVKFPFTSQMSIEVTEDYVPERLLDNATFRPENLFLFQDDALQAYIRPVYGFTHTTLNFKYRAKDKTEAIRWRDGIRNHTTMNREQFLHDIKYHFLLPLEMMVILKEIHRMRENVAPYGEPFDQYFSEHRSPALVFLTNQSGSQGRWGVQQAQARVQGWFDWEGVPEAGGKEDDADTWTISFAYHFHYDKPIACTFDYPLVVHNQFMDAKYRPGPEEMPPPSLETMQLNYSWAAAKLYPFEAQNSLWPLNIRQGYSIPAEDEFIPSQIIPGTQRVFTALIQIDPANRRFLLNLKDLGADVEINPAMTCCLNSEWQYMTKPWWSVFNLSLYVGYDMLDWKLLTVDQNLNVFTTFDLDLRKVYHLRFSIYKDLRTINQNALKRLQYCPDCLNLIISTIAPEYGDNPLENCIVDGRLVKMTCLNQIIDDIGNYRPGDNPFKTVQTTGILSLKRNNITVGS